MAEQTLKGALGTKDAPKDEKPADAKDDTKAARKVRDDHGEELDELTDEERQANREAYLRAWPLDEADETR